MSTAPRAGGTSRNAVSHDDVRRVGDLRKQRPPGDGEGDDRRFQREDPAEEPKGGAPGPPRVASAEEPLVHVRVAKQEEERGQQHRRVVDRAVRSRGNAQVRGQSRGYRGHAPRFRDDEGERPADPDDHDQAVHHVRVGHGVHPGQSRVEDHEGRDADHGEGAQILAGEEPLHHGRARPVLVGNDDQVGEQQRHGADDPRCGAETGLRGCPGS